MSLIHRFLILLCWTSLAVSVLASLEPLNASSLIRVDQVGYVASSSKVGVVKIVLTQNPQPSSNIFTWTAPNTVEFEILRFGDASIAFSGNLSQNYTFDPQSGDLVRYADFSDLKEVGTFVLQVNGTGYSVPFLINSAKDLLSDPFYTAMRAFYGFRCGTAVSLKMKSLTFAHGQCHTRFQVSLEYHSSTNKKGPSGATGGWHDAGDFGKYVVTGGVATGTLLHAYEMFGEAIKGVTLDIPESGTGDLPDMLSEIKWELDWLLLMQDKSDGGVWFKQTSGKFPEFIMPEQDRDPYYIVGVETPTKKSTCATGDFAAVTAIAFRLFKEYNLNYAQMLISASETAFQWTIAHPWEHVFANPWGIETGIYPDGNCEDEMFWAAAELYRSTKKTIYLSYIQSNMAKFKADKYVTWDNTGSLGLWTLAMNNQGNDTLISQITGVADSMVSYAQTNGYLHVLKEDDYLWGSNGIILNKAMHLLVAHKLTGNKSYLQTAMDNLHYILGRNTFSKSFVSQIGSRYPMNPHLRQAFADNITEPWPGYIVGGPNKYKEDSVIAASGENYPARCWTDQLKSYSTNEVAINWNSPLVFVLAGLIHSEYQNSTVTEDPTSPPEDGSSKRRTLTAILTPILILGLIGGCLAYYYWHTKSKKSTKASADKAAASEPAFDPAVSLPKQVEEAGDDEQMNQKSKIETV